MNVKLKLSKKYEAILWSYIGGAVTADGLYVISYLRKTIVDGLDVQWNWATFGWFTLGGLLAPVFKAVNPKFKEFGVLDLVKPFERKIELVVASKSGEVIPPTK